MDQSQIWCTGNENKHDISGFEKSKESMRVELKNEFMVKGDKGDAGTSASAASYEYFVPNAESGYFDIYKDGSRGKPDRLPLKSHR